jgi:hypothetical protein
MRLPYPTANEAVSFFRDNWNWIKDQIGWMTASSSTAKSRSNWQFGFQGKRPPVQDVPVHPLQALPEASTLTGMPTPEESNDLLTCQRHSAR